MATALFAKIEKSQHLTQLIPECRGFTVFPIFVMRYILFLTDHLAFYKKVRAFDPKYYVVTIVNLCLLACKMNSPL